jgi:diguanylate cyclase (GGDEF)-like protein
MLGKEHSMGRDHAMGHPALTDPQTGLANGLHFELVYSYLFEAGDRGMTFTVMLVSVGKASPERLRTLGEIVHNTTRTADLVAHVGNGRYVVLLFGTNLQGARIAADRLETALKEKAPGPVSLGLAAYRADLEDSAMLLEAADTALLTAEAAGGGVEMA